MSGVVFVHGILIFFARILDVSLGTLRTLAVVNGRRLTAWCLGVVEISIWITVVAQVMPYIRENPFYTVFYALGFATGGWVGMVIEGMIGQGERLVTLFTRRGAAVAEGIMQKYILTKWHGEAPAGRVESILLRVPRKKAREIVAAARRIDPDCFYTIQRIDGDFDLRPTITPRTGWRAAMRKAK